MKGPRCRARKGEEMTSLVRSPPWTPEEDERLRKLALTGTSVAAMAKQISAALQRSAALPVEGCGGQIEAESEGEMKQVGARHDIIREWRSLPKEQRQTDEQAEAFAMQIKGKYKFSNDSADPYQTVRGWLLSYLSLMRGLGVNAKDKGEMTDDEKSADPGLSVASRL